MAGSWRRTVAARHSKSARRCHAWGREREKFRLLSGPGPLARPGSTTSIEPNDALKRPTLQAGDYWENGHEDRLIIAPDHGTRRLARSPGSRRPCHAGRKAGPAHDSGPADAAHTVRCRNPACSYWNRHACGRRILRLTAKARYAASPPASVLRNASPQALARLRTRNM